MRFLLSLSIPAVAIAALSGCTDPKIANEAQAMREIDKLTPLVTADCDEVRSGLPAGAKKLGELIDADPGGNPAALQTAIGRARESVPKLRVAKSTFFSFMDTTGTVIRSEADPDLLSQRSVLPAFPALKKAVEADGPSVEAYGEMNEMRGIRTGQDMAWVIAHPVVDAEKKVKGAFLTGWSFRRYALRLEDQAKRDLTEQAQKDGKNGQPIVYVYVVKGKKAYGSPTTPDVNAKAIEDLDVVPKSASAPLKTSIEVTGRSFGLVVKKTPELGDDAALAVLLSDL